MNNTTNPIQVTIFETTDYLTYTLRSTHTVRNQDGKCVGHYRTKIDAINAAQQLTIQGRTAHLAHTEHEVIQH